MTIGLARTQIKLLMIAIALLLVSCTTQPLTSAPVINAWHDPDAMKSQYRVQKNDTLYSIAWAFDLDYRDLAASNHLVPPYHLKPGQTLTMVIPSNTTDINSDNAADLATTYALHNFSNARQRPFQEITTAPLSNKEAVLALQEPNKVQMRSDEPVILPEWQMLTESKPPKQMARLNQDRLSPPLYSGDVIDQPKQSNPGAFVPLQEPASVAASPLQLKQRNGKWPWPAQGEVIKGFSLAGDCCNKGIDIGGQLGDPITAVAPGKVVYSGSGLRGYGNLIIIKHSDNYLSAYAYNRKRLVKEGDLVKAGSEIGKMGQNGVGKTLLHFEIRRNGKPVNPLLYL